MNSIHVKDLKHELALLLEKLSFLAKRSNGLRIFIADLKKKKANVKLPRSSEDFFVIISFFLPG